MGAQGEIQPSFRQTTLTARKAERKKQTQTAASVEQAAPHPQPPFPRQRKIARQSRRRFLIKAPSAVLWLLICNDFRFQKALFMHALESVLREVGLYYCLSSLSVTG